MDICTDIFPFFLLLNIYNVSIFIHMHFNALQKGNIFFKRVFTSVFSEIQLTTCNLIFETSLQNTCERIEVMKMRQTPVS